MAINNQPRPTCLEDLKALSAKYPDIQTSCISCGAMFDEVNTHSVAGWRETQISGMCEDCFDELFKEPDGGQ